MLLGGVCVLESLDEGDGALVSADDEGDGMLASEAGAANGVVAEPFSAASVCESRVPDAEMPCAVWKSRSALSVFGPMMPSIAPGSWPLSFKACCACWTDGSALIAPFSAVVAVEALWSEGLVA